MVFFEIMLAHMKYETEIIQLATSPLLAQQHGHNLTLHQQHHIPLCCSVKKTKRIQGEGKDLKSLLHSHFFCFLSLSISLYSDLPFKFTTMCSLLPRAWLLWNLTEHSESCSHRSRNWMRPHEEMIKKYIFCKEKSLTIQTQTIITKHTKKNQDEVKNYSQTLLGLVASVTFSAHIKGKENPHFLLSLIHVHICGNQVEVVLCLNLSQVQT